MTKDQVYSKKIRPSEVSVSSGSKFIGGVFLYVFLALAITSVVATGMGALFYFTISKNSETAASSFIYILLISVFAYIPVLIWARIAAARNGKTMTTAYICYSAVMGVMISSFTVLVDFYIIAMAFGLTCLSFGVMALIAWNTKKNLSILSVVASGLFFGVIMLFLFNFILGLFLSDAQMLTLSWTISILVLVSVVLITVVDLNNVKQIAMNGGAGKNVALMCALNLYVDFIYIFIRIVSYLVRMKNK